MSAKPIFIVLVPVVVKANIVIALYEHISGIVDDYHVLVFKSSHVEKMEFKTFYDENFTESNFTELKELVISFMDNKKSQ